MKTLLNIYRNFSKKVLLCALVISALFSGCLPPDQGQEDPAPTQEIPTNYWTAKEAYQHIKPHLEEWHSDAIVVSTSSIAAGKRTWRIQPDGKAPWWGFTVQSPSALVKTGIYLRDDQITVGIDQIPGFEKPSPQARSEIRFEELIDTDQALAIAAASGIKPGYFLIEIYFAGHESVHDGPYWNIGFERGTTLEKSIRIIIDARTGGVLRNDFLSSGE